jgi:hypothetical protein
MAMGQVDVPKCQFLVINFSFVANLAIAESDYEDKNERLFIRNDGKTECSAHHNNFLIMSFMPFSTTLSLFPSPLFSILNHENGKRLIRGVTAF